MVFDGELGSAGNDGSSVGGVAEEEIGLGAAGRSLGHVELATAETEDEETHANERNRHEPADAFALVTGRKRHEHEQESRETIKGVKASISPRVRLRNLSQPRRHESDQQNNL